MKPEEAARKGIDQRLEASGWVVQDYSQLDLSASLGVAVREFPLNSGETDYLLFVSRRAIGVIEAKPIGTTLSGVDTQSKKYLYGVPTSVPHVDPLPYAYESTGVETLFRDIRDPDYRSRWVFTFHRPETLVEWLSEETTLREQLKNMPPLLTDGLRECQVNALTGLEQSFADARPRALIQMTMGSGKTFAAVSSVYRLIKFVNARRVLFLVDRSNLGRQAFTEFQQYITPDDGRKFIELYNVQHLTTNTLDPVCRVCITTIQRLYSMLNDESDYDAENEEKSSFEAPNLGENPKEIAYNPLLPIETFDIIIVDECHRSIYHLWRQVLEYFDAFIVGLTATPSKHTLAFFNKNLVTEYSNDRAIADGVNVGYEVYRIKTKFTEEGNTVTADYYVERRDKLTREKRWDQLDDDLTYLPPQLDRDVVAPDQIRTIIRTFRERLFTEIFPERQEVPKTLIYAKDDSHAEDIVHIVREEFGKGNEFCKKITYRTSGEKPEDLISSFRNSYNPRIAVSVDMISTGTDIKPIECLVFMRNVKSRTYFEQMLGRGTRTISPTDLVAVTPDAQHKTHFVVVDTVGVFETVKVDAQPLERMRSEPFDMLLKSVAVGNRENDTLSSVAGRLAVLDREIGDKDQATIEAVAGGVSLGRLINSLLDAIDPDVQLDTARALFGTDTPTEGQLRGAIKALKDEACIPFDKPLLRETLVEVKRRSEQVIDPGIDDVIEAHWSDSSGEKSQAIVDDFTQFITDHKDELTALQIIYNKPYGQRHLTFEAIKQLADALESPPYNMTPDVVWKAYERLKRSKVRGAGPHKLLTDIISLVRFAIGESAVLEPFIDVVDGRFDQWMEEQTKYGRSFTPEQIEWLVMIKSHIATSIRIELDDFQYTPFAQKGGVVKASELFGGSLSGVLDELNDVLAAQ